MCGIVGYVGANLCASYILDGLKGLEYRGYDSAGIAVLEQGTAAPDSPPEIRIERSVGKLVNLEEKLKGFALTGTVGIGHTRWATHGRPTEENAHPHFMEDVVVVHNGIIENYVKLREELAASGYHFTSETDTEVVPHLIHQYLSEGCDLETAFRKSLDHLEGSYALAVICARDPRRIFAARRASPLVIGFGEGENFVASDIPALLAHTRRFIFLEDGDLAVLDADTVKVIDSEGDEAERPVTEVDWTPAMAEKGGYKHFMLKEIFEQPRALADTLSGRLHPVEGEIELEGGEAAEKIAREIDALHIVACGTSYHAALVGKYWIERLARMPVTVDLASEYRYRDPLLDDKTGLLLVSQSGETADTLAALELGREKGAPVLGICNVVGSSLSRAADATLYTHAGPEIGVASTKAFTTQLVTLYLMALFLGKHRGTLTGDALTSRMSALRKTPRMVKKVLALDDGCREMAHAMMDARSALFLGRGRNYPIALEGALKLKEISYIHAEGYAAGEMKHGPIALVDDGLPVVSIMTCGINYEKMVSNIEEIRARSGRIFAIATEGDKLAEGLSEQVLYVPDFFEELMPVINSIPLQLLAYHVAELKGTDVDQPRNLAKSVTVE
jgi:glucosamine--fructose-6-phosphate aminotransferase (isomerizing)